MPPAKLFESLDSQATAAQAMALAGVHPSFHPSLVNQQVLDQIRQAGAVPGKIFIFPLEFKSIFFLFSEQLFSGLNICRDYEK